MQDMNNNVAIAIMMKVNELASRYGVEPYDFVAVLKYEKAPEPALGGVLASTGRSVLAYEVPPSDPSQLERFELMLETLGASNDTGLLVAEDEQIIKALNHALQVAPRGRGRG
jgi:hypothetical protein